MAVRLRCPLCRATFHWDIVNDGYPDDCKVCGQHVGHDREDDDIVMPSIARAREATKRTDQVYRDMERGSEIRAQMAADQLGVPVSEMSDIKITNLRTAKKEGDIAAVPLPVNPVSEFMAKNPGVGGFQGTGAQFAGAVQTGPAPNAGAQMRSALQQHHGNLTRGHAVSDAPAQETLQPGYVRRG